MSPTFEISPVTESMLRRDLARLGVDPGMTPVVHSALSSIERRLAGSPKGPRS